MDDFNSLVEFSKEFRSMKLHTDGKVYVVVKKKKVEYDESIEEITADSPPI